MNDIEVVVSVKLDWHVSYVTHLRKQATYRMMDLVNSLSVEMVLRVGGQNNNVSWLSPMLCEVCLRGQARHDGSLKDIILRVIRAIQAEMLKKGSKIRPSEWTIYMYMLYILAMEHTIPFRKVNNFVVIFEPIFKIVFAYERICR